MTVLLVEDSEDLAFLVEMALEGWHVVVAPTGGQALQICAAPEPIDLIMLDSDLPDGRGADFLAELCQRAPVVWFSSLHPDETALPFLKGRVNKPFQPLRLKEELIELTR